MTGRQSLVDSLVGFERRPFIQVLRRTMIILFPLALVGSLAYFLSQVCFAPTGFIGNVLHIRRWLPAYWFFRDVLNDADTATVGLLALYAAFLGSYLTVRRHYEAPLAGIAAAASYLLIFYHNIRGGGMIEMRYYNANWFIVGVVVGYLVGRLYLWLGPTKAIEDTPDQDARMFTSARAFAVILAIALIFHIAYALFRTYNLDLSMTQGVTSLLNRHSNFGTSILISLVATILTWLGFAESVNISNSMFSNELYLNLTNALTHKNNWHVPYPFTPASLYNGYGLIGGVGVSLALLIAILWVENRPSHRRIIKASAGLTFFNLNLPLGFGIALVLNPVYLVPFILLPLFNMVCASGLVLLKVIPPLVYPIPTGTPGILGPLMGSGGNWVTLLVSLLLLWVDVLTYLPFVRLARTVDDRLAKLEKGAAGHENN